MSDMEPSAPRVWRGGLSGFTTTSAAQGGNRLPMEQVVPILGGGALILFGLSRRHPIGLVPALAGGLLIARAATLRHPSQETARGDDARPARRDGGSPSIPQVLTGPIHVEKTISINRSPEELYTFWHDFANLPRFMQHLESVQVLDEGRSHWVAKAPAGTSVEWDAEITEDQPGTGIAWRALPGADVVNAGTVLFTPGPQGRGTEVRVTLDYQPPVGGLGAIVARLFGEEPSQQVMDDLRHFKQLMEAGEIPTTEGQSSGREKDQAA
jgi:uncharacterized membrane protein